MGDHVSFEVEVEQVSPTTAQVTEGALTFSVTECGSRRTPMHTWVRRWARLEGPVLSSFTDAQPAGDDSKAAYVLDLTSCTAAALRKLNRKECARPHTFVLEGEPVRMRPTLVTLLLPAVFPAVDPPTYAHSNHNGGTWQIAAGTPRSWSRCRRTARRRWRSGPMLCASPCTTCESGGCSLAARTNRAASARQHMLPLQ